MYRLWTVHITLVSLWMSIPKKRKDFGLGSSRFYYRVLIMVSLAVLNLVLTFTVHSPQCPRGYLGPGPNMINSAGQNLSTCAGGANIYIDRYLPIAVGGWIGDRLVLGPDSVPKGTYARCSYIFGCEGFNQEGVLGTLNFVFGAYLGSVVGEFHTQYRRKVMKQMKFFAEYAGISLVAAAAIGMIPGLEFVPVNNQVWSVSTFRYECVIGTKYGCNQVSYVLLGNAFSVGIYALLKFLSQKGLWNGWPFKSVGKNAI